jgi:hypothetical protein
MLMGCVADSRRLLSRFLAAALPWCPQSLGYLDAADDEKANLGKLVLEGGCSASLILI